MRICADFKATVNKQLQDAHYPIPKIQDLFHKLRGGKYFCSIDIFKAYLHLPVDEESTKIQTLSTHRGTYTVNRLFFGIKTAPNEYHKFIDQFVRDLPGTTAYFDDLIVQGSNIDECRERLYKLLQR